MSSETGENEMDAVSDSSDRLRPGIRSIHCWHTEKRFSKFAFRRGDYASMDLGPFLEMKSNEDYTTVVAVSSARLSDEEYARVTGSSAIMSARAWIRRLP